MHALVTERMRIHIEQDAVMKEKIQPLNDSMLFCLFMLIDVLQEHRLCLYIYHVGALKMFIYATVYIHFLYVSA